MHFSLLPDAWNSLGIDMPPPVFCQISVLGRVLNFLSLTGFRLTAKGEE